MGAKASKVTKQFERVMRIAHEHILYARRHPQRLSEVARRMKATEDATLALGIADQISEEFELTERN